VCLAKVLHLCPKHVSEHLDNILSCFVMLACSAICALVFQMVCVLRVFLPTLCMQLWYLPSVSHVRPISSALFDHSNSSKIMFREEHRLGGVREQGVTENICAYEGRSDRGVEDSAHWGDSRGTATEYHSGDQIKEDETAGTGGICTGEMHTEFWWGNLKTKSRCRWDVIVK